jgi:phosphoribosylformylglycinamidine synthase
MKASVYITLKRGVLDPQGQSAAATLARLGFDEVSGVRIGKYIEVELDTEDRAAAESRLSEMCERLLANTVIEDYRFEIDQPAEGPPNRGPLVGEID